MDGERKLPVERPIGEAISVCWRRLALLLGVAGANFVAVCVATWAGTTGVVGWIILTVAVLFLVGGAVELVRNDRSGSRGTGLFRAVARAAVAMLGVFAACVLAILTIWGSGDRMAAISADVRVQTAVAVPPTATAATRQSTEGLTTPQPPQPTTAVATTGAGVAVDSCPEVLLTAVPEEVEPGEAVQLLVKLSRNEPSAVYYWEASKAGLASEGGPHSSTTNWFIVSEGLAGQTVRIEVSAVGLRCGRTVGGSVTIRVAKGEESPAISTMKPSSVPPTSPHATLLLVPASVRVLPGERFSSDVVVEPGLDGVEEVRVYVYTEPRYLEVIALRGGGDLGRELESAYNPNTGRINYAAAAVGGAVRGTVRLVTVEFRATERISATISTALDFGFSGSQVTEVKSGGRNVLGQAVGGAVIILVDEQPLPTQTAAQVAESPTPTQPSPVDAPSPTATFTAQPTSKPVRREPLDLLFPPDGYVFDKRIARFDWSGSLAPGEYYRVQAWRESGTLSLNHRTREVFREWWPEASGEHEWRVIVVTENDEVLLESETRRFRYDAPDR